MSKMKKTRKPGGGRKKLKPEYDAGKNLKEQLDAAVAFYDSEMSLRAIGDELGLNPIKARKQPNISGCKIRPRLQGGNAITVSTTWRPQTAALPLFAGNDQYLIERRQSFSVRPVQCGNPCIAGCCFL